MIYIQAMEFIGIIPARYASTRFPGKPLAMINGKTMIQRVYEQAVKVLKVVYVATDDDRIIEEVERFGGNAVLTSVHHKSGTDRCTEAIKHIEEDLKKRFSVVINIQGDEPFIQPGQINMLCRCFSDEQTQIATLVKEFKKDENIFDPNKVKVVFDKEFSALYFSRLPIPFIRNAEQDKWMAHHKYYHHIGVYGYRKDVLYALAKLPASSLETAESLEQLRWLENGYRIKVDVTEYDSIGIDTPEDLVKVSEMFRD